MQRCITCNLFIKYYKETSAVIFKEPCPLSWAVRTRCPEILTNENRCPNYIPKKNGK